MIGTNVSHPVRRITRPLNILFSSTRQWNVGDEFIYFGVRRLLEELGIIFNPVLYNRHPSINPPNDLIPNQRLRERLFDPQVRKNDDNSFFLGNASLIDYVIFAGTPEWSAGRRIDPLLDFIISNRLRCAFIGVGANGSVDISHLLGTVFRDHADVILSRDRACFEATRGYGNSYLEVCPALFCSDRERLREGIGKIGVVIQDQRTRWQRVPVAVCQYGMEWYPRIASRYPVELIAHYIDDLEFAQRNFPHLPCWYSSYAEGFEQIYERFDLVISTRVHGCGLAASLGIPNILIRHDGRSETAELFGSVIINSGADLLSTISAIDVKTVSRRLLAMKQQRKLGALTLLRQSLSITSLKSLEASL